jgi:hypothetical protein
VVSTTCFVEIVTVATSAIEGAWGDAWRSQLFNKRLHNRTIETTINRTLSLPSMRHL